MNRFDTVSLMESSSKLSGAIQYSDTTIQSLIDLTAEFYWEQDPDQHFVRVIFASHASLRNDPQDYIGRTFSELGALAGSKPTVWSEYRALFTGRKPIRNFTIWHAPSPHEIHYFSISGDPVFDGHQQFQGYCGVVRDITEEKRNADYASTFELAAVGLAHVDANGRFLHVNHKLCEMLGYSARELLALTVQQISHPDDKNLADEGRHKLHAGEISSFRIEKRYLHKDGHTIWAGLICAVKQDPTGQVLYDISVVEDISGRKAAEERVQYLATHDEMTGLPNRALFNQLLRLTIDSSVRYKRQFAVLFIDLDRFKMINDTLGHEAGDRVLKEMSGRFRSCLRASDVVARLGGDEFVVLVQEIHDSSQVAVVARNILSAAIRPLEIMGQECRVTASVGISLFPGDGGDEQSLMKHADIAMYLAKEEGKNNFQFYSSDIKSHSIEKMALETHLRRAMELDEFTVHYQAKVNIKTGKVSGVEALLRWNNPVLGSVSPGQFIPICEEMGLIIPLGKWVIKQACEQSLKWQEHGLPALCISVNLSPRQFNDPDLVPYIKETLARTGMDPALLELEITEGMVMHDTKKSMEKLLGIKALGVRIAIDDFGTGYSSLSQLKLFPVNTLKVDRSFIRELSTNSDDRAITQAIIAMGRTLGLTVVAEGVETAEQETFLRDHACDEMQGFYFSKPISPQAFETLLRAQLS